MILNFSFVSHLHRLTDIFNGFISETFRNAELHDTDPVEDEDEKKNERDIDDEVINLEQNEEIEEKSVPNTVEMEIDNVSPQLDDQQNVDNGIESPSNEVTSSAATVNNEVSQAAIETDAEAEADKQSIASSESDGIESEDFIIDITDMYSSDDEKITAESTVRSIISDFSTANDSAITTPNAVKVGAKATALRARKVIKRRNSIIKTSIFGSIVSRKWTKNTPCEVCEKKFKSQAQLVSHRQQHLKEFPFHCRICMRGFSIRKTNYLHEQNCTFDRWECHLCKYSAPCHTHLEIHMRKHSGLRPFKCSKCSSKCKSKSELAMHNVRTHKKST